MKIKEYDEMVAYLTRKKPKETKRVESTLERIERINHEYEGGPRVRNEMLKNYKTKTTPVKIDISGINTDLNALENSVYSPDPKRPVPKEVELEGIETILGIKTK